MHFNVKLSGLTRAAVSLPVGALVATTFIVAAPGTATAAVPSTAPTVTGQLLRVSDLSRLVPTSPDPSGVTWMPDRNRLMIVDGEVNETPLYQGTNMYETTLDPTVTKRGTTLPVHQEPTGVAYNQSNGHLFVSNDDLKRVYEVDDGADATFGTADDVVTSFSTAALGNTDPEDIAYDDATGDLFIVDGLGAKVTRVTANSNGFDGAPPVGDDSWTEFDLAILGAGDPEGITYDRARGTLLVVDDSAARIFELTRYGSLINAIDISSLNTQAAAGVTVAPRSGNTSQRSYYIVDRGLDNNSHPDENDGRLFELSASLPALTNLPPWAQAGPDLEIELPETADLAGIVSDDGQPTSTVFTQWSVLSGPGPVQFANANSPATTATFTVPGVYTLRLTADDGDRPDIDDMTVTVVEQGGVHASSYPVKVGTDDAEEAASGFVSATSADLELVDDGTTNQTVGVRFAGMGVPRNAVIESAYIQFQTDEAGTSTGAASLRIHGEATDHASTYLDRVNGNITSRPTTVSSTPWVPDPWPVLFEAGPAQRTPNIGQIVQEIVDRPGWASGNAMAFMVTGSGTRTAESRDGTAAPVLHVNWRRPIAGANRAPIVSAGTDQEIYLPADATLSGTVSDDGLPADPGTVTAAWTKVSGPGTVTFADAAAVTTTVSFSEAGTYVLRLTGDDGALQTSDDVTVTVLPADAPKGVTVALASGADDAQEGGGASGKFVSLTGADLELGTDVTATTSFSTWVGLRYALPVPAGAIIDSATVRFTVDEVSTGTSDLTIAATATDNAPAFATGAGNLSNRPRTNTTVAWAPPAWTTVNTSGPGQTTPNLAAVLQEVVDRPGWSQGNHAAIMINGTGRRTADSFEGGAARAAVLDLTWHLPPADTNRAPTVSAGPDAQVQLPGEATLSGTVTDDGLPTTPGTVTSTWTKVSGPGTVTFADAAAPATTAAFSAEGTYVLRLTGDDGALQASDDVTITVSPDDVSESATVTIANGADDAQEGGGSTGKFVSLTGADLKLGSHVTATTSYSTLVGLRYALPVPAGAVIDSATVRFTVDEVNTETANLTIAATATDNAPAFATGAGNLSDRPRTNTTVAWATPAWTTVNTSGPAQTTPNLDAVLQEVVDRPGWAQGNHAAIMITGTGRRIADSFEGGAARAAVLDLTWHMPPASGNRAPTVSAGPDAQVQLPAEATLSGTVTDDGLPSDPGTVTSTWTKVSGPGTVTFGDAAAPATTASFSEPGVYVLRLTGSDGDRQASDDVTIAVLADPAATANTAPVVNAGPDSTVTMPGSAQLTGTVTDDGLPLPATLTSTWTRVSGPGTVTFGDATATSTTASFSAAGVYVLRLTGSDGALQASDDVTVTVQQAVNAAPVVSAGTNQTVTLAAGAQLNGTVTDDGLPSGVLTVQWTRHNGPNGGTVTFGSPTSPVTTATFSRTGTYVLRLTASDGALTTSASITVRVR